MMSRCLVMTAMIEYVLYFKIWQTRASYTHYITATFVTWFIFSFSLSLYYVFAQL